MEECNAVNNPIIPGQVINKDEQGVKVDETYFKQIVKSLMYLTATRPNLKYSVGPIRIVNKAIISLIFCSHIQLHLLSYQILLPDSQHLFGFLFFFVCLRIFRLKCGQ